METRPIPTIPLTTTDKIVETAGWLVLLATWGLAVASYASLPASIPIHYDGAGLPNRYDHKATILIFPFLATVLSAILAALSRRPQVLNYPVPLTEANAGAQYANAARLLCYLRLTLGLDFGLTTLRTIQTARGQAEGLGVWFLPLTLVLLLGPLAYFLVRALRLEGQRVAGQND